MTIPSQGMPDTSNPNVQLAAAVLVQAFYSACAHRKQMGDNLTLERRQAIYEEVWRIWSETARALATGKATPAPKLYASASELASAGAREVG
ncbi:MAG TPA: hypothetical protein VEI24_06465 [Nitrospiria bacterium]|nr:hypothetical protein [Nitrospiria bacterium]